MQQTRSDNRSVILHVMPNYSQVNRGPKGKVVFSRYGSEYFLRQAWIPSTDFGMDFSPSQHETSVAKEYNNQKHWWLSKGAERVVFFEPPWRDCS
jgi:hypothetical protein